LLDLSLGQRILNFFIAYSDTGVHPHDLVYQPSIPNASCDTCSSDIKNQPGFICSKNCDYITCTACFYESRLQKTIPFIEEELSLVIDGERWWGPEIVKPKVTHDQNNLVLSVILSYIKFQKENAEKNSKLLKIDLDHLKKFFPEWCIAEEVEIVSEDDESEYEEDDYEGEGFDIEVIGDVAVSAVPPDTETVSLTDSLDTPLLPK